MGSIPPRFISQPFLYFSNHPHLHLVSFLLLSLYLPHFFFQFSFMPSLSSLSSIPLHLSLALLAFLHFNSFRSIIFLPSFFFLPSHPFILFLSFLSALFILTFPFRPCRYFLSFLSFPSIFFPFLPFPTFRSILQSLHFFLSLLLLD